MFVGLLDPLKLLVHHEGVHVACVRVQECLWEGSYDGEAAALPEVDGALVGADDEVELHGAEALGARLVEGVPAHAAGDSAAGCRCCSHVSAVGYVRAAALLIGAEVVAAQDGTVFFGYKDVMISGEPVTEPIFPP